MSNTPSPPAAPLLSSFFFDSIASKCKYFTTTKMNSAKDIHDNTIDSTHP